MIGPEARRSASGRVVVVAVLQVTVGFLAAVMGSGPLVTPSEPPERAVGGAGVVLGVALMIGGTSLLVRRGPSRVLGMAGAVAMLVLGAIVALLAAASTSACGPAVGTGASCYGLTLAIGIVGVAIGVIGLASLVVIGRAHAAALRRRGDRGLPPRR